MMRRYAIYDYEGRIIRIITCPEPLALAQCHDGEWCIEVGEDVSDATHCIARGGLVERHRMGAGINTQGLTVNISSLPAGAVVLCYSAETSIQDGEVSVDFDVPGVYEIRLRPPPQYLDETLEVAVG